MEPGTKLQLAALTKPIRSITGSNGNYYYNATQEEVWSISNWTSLSQFWGQPYNTTAHGGSDPEPNTPNHYYIPPFPLFGGLTHHWNTYYVTIEQDYIADDVLSHDYALDQDANIAPHN